MRSSRIAFVLALVLVFSSLSAMTPTAAGAWRSVPASNPFTDVHPHHWHHDSVSWAWINGIARGTSPTTFSPNANVTRGEFATFLYRIAGSPNVTPAHRFTDVPASQFFAAPVAWAHANGIAAGFNPTTFAPNNPITRQELVTMLFRYVRHIGGDTRSPSGAINKYTDARMVSSWATGTMNWAVHHGILGVGTSTLEPTGNAHRSHAVATLYRVVRMFNIKAPNLLPLAEIYGASLASTSATITMYNLQAFADEVHWLTNIERTKAKLSPLGQNQALTQTALVRANEIVIHFDHSRPDGRAVVTAFRENNVKFYTIGENLAFGYRTPAEVVKAWMDSSGHRKAILNPEFGQLGVGIVMDNNGRLYWVQAFTD